MELVDTHCHIHEAGHGQGPVHDKWRKADITPRSLAEAARHEGVTQLICVGCTLQDSRVATEFVVTEQSCWASVGIHPHETEAHNNTATLSQLAELATKPKVVAIGECGLDYFYTHSSPKDQREVLEFQLQLARDHDLPVIFHVREAFDDFWPIFDNFPGLRGVLHSFTDTEAHMQRALTNGLYLGVNGIATFTKDDQQRAVFRRIPLQQLLLETDAPFLTPAPVRGTINQPKNVTYITQFLAELRSESVAQIATATTRNARKLFGLH